MAKSIKHPETIALHGGEYRSDPATIISKIYCLKVLFFQYF